MDYRTPVRAVIKHSALDMPSAAIDRLIIAFGKTNRKLSFKLGYFRPLQPKYPHCYWSEGLQEFILNTFC